MPADLGWCWVLSPAYVRNWNRRGWSLPSLYCRPAEEMDFFRVPNIVYFHPGLHEAAQLEELRGYGKVLCNVGDPETLKDTDRQVKKAAAFGELSRGFPNVVGAVVDDFSTAVKGKRMPVDLMEKTYLAVKSGNPSLELQVILYSMHLDMDFSAYAPYFDSLSLWVWKACDLGGLDEYVRKARRAFPEKRIHLGLYLYDYGDVGDTLPMDLVQFEFRRARQYCKEGSIEGFHIICSHLREELRSEQARWVADFLADGAGD